MKIFNNPVSKWWFSLEPAIQYITWICTFCLSVAIGILLVVVAVEMNLANAIILPALYGIGILVFIFLSVVLYLTIMWPRVKEHIKDDIYWL